MIRTIILMYFMAVVWVSRRFCRHSWHPMSDGHWLLDEKEQVTSGNMYVAATMAHCPKCGEVRVARADGKICYSTNKMFTHFIPVAVTPGEEDVDTYQVEVHVEDDHWCKIAGGLPTRSLANALCVRLNPYDDDEPVVLRVTPERRNPWATLPCVR